VTWLARGWQVFAPEPGVTDWVNAVRRAGLAATADPGLRRHGGTWCAGVDALPNDARGAVPGGPALSCEALATAQSITGALPLHPAQVSVTYPGYPGRDAQDTEAAHRYLCSRDAAHLDGLLPIGPDRRRHLREPHGYILGLPLTRADAAAAPLVVYDGSHMIMRDAFRAAFDGRPPGDWPMIDVTEVYQAARRRCFAECARIALPAAPGQAVLLHRLALHGIAP
jgi:hypothetical protein